jgi:WD40 repeat protein/tRNA A-37 threonylcarbamoyl transferase component Bud32
MTAPAHPCDPNRLRLSLEDRLADGAQAELEQHLELCVGCRAELEEMAAASVLWRDARSLGNEVGSHDGHLAAGHDDGAGALTCDWLPFLDPPDPDRPGTLGRLRSDEIVEVLGRGGMGVVLKARDPALERTVAIKVLTPALAHGVNARRRFAREARAVAAVGHEHIVAIHAVDEFRGLPYLVMQHVAGRSLQERLDESGPLDVKEILRIGMQAARALAAAHAQGVVHRDIKPANILLENCVERVKLTDFGLARAIDDASVTQSGVIAGTPQYMAPEQARGEPVAAPADLFSLGAVLYAMAAGRPPFRADSAMAVLKRVCEMPHRPIREINPDVPGWLENLIDRLLAKEPADRLKSAAEVADVLEQGLAHLQQPRVAPPPDVPAGKPANPLVDDGPGANMPRAPRRLALAAAFILLFGACLGASEAAGWTKVSEFVATVLRIRTPEGTLVIECNDPEVKVRIDESDVVIAGTGMQEVRLNTGKHRLQAFKDGKPVKDVLVSITRDGKELVKVSLETDSTKDALDRWLKPPAPKVGSESGPAKRHGDMVAPPSHVSQCMSCHTNVSGSNLEQWWRAPAMRGNLFASHADMKECTLCHQDVYAANVDQARSKEQPPLPSWQQPHARLDRGRAAVWALAYSPDGRRLAIGQIGKGERASFLRVWDLEKNCETAAFSRPAGFRCVAFSPDGKTLAAGSFDGFLTLAAVDLGAIEQHERARDRLNKLEGELFEASKLLKTLDKNALANGDADPSPAKQVDERTLARIKEEFNKHPDVGALGREIAEAKKHLERVTSAARQNNDPSVYAARKRVDKLEEEWQVLWEDQYVEILARLEAAGAILGHHDVEAIKRLKDRIASLEKERARLSGAASPTEIPQGSPVGAIAFKPDGKAVLVGTSNGRVRFHYFESGSPVVELRYTGRVLALAISPDGSKIAVGGSAGSIQVYDHGGRSHKTTLQTVAGAREVESLDFSPDGKLLAAACLSSVEVWDTATWKATELPLRRRTDLLCVKFSRDGKILATSEGDWRMFRDENMSSSTILWDVAAQAEGRRLNGHSNSIWALAFSPDGKTIASGSIDQTVKLWDLATGKLIQTIVPGTDGEAAADRTRINLFQARMRELGYFKR